MRNSNLVLQGVPPRQDKHNIRVPMALYSSRGDLLTPYEEAKDIEVAFEGFVKKHYTVEDPNFTHFCFIFNKHNISHFHDMIEFFRESPIGGKADEGDMETTQVIGQS